MLKQLYFIKKIQQNQTYNIIKYFKIKKLIY